MKKKIQILAIIMLAISSIATAQDTILAQDSNMINVNAIQDSMLMPDTLITQDTNQAVDSTIAVIDEAQDSTIFQIHLRDVAENYGLQKAFFEDTNAVENHLAAQPQDFADLIQQCQTIATNARTMIADLDLDYRDGVVWLDTNLCIINYEEDRNDLQRLAAKADELKEHYTELENERIEHERKLAEQRAKEEARRKQMALDNRLATLHEEIEAHHKTINNICNGKANSKAHQKIQKDLYYAYLAVYNKFDVTTETATDRLISENDMLNTFQTNLIDSVLSENSYLTRIDNFKDQLKDVASENGYSNVYKSYSRLFKRISIAINFSTIDEYFNYIKELLEVINTQQLYMESITYQREIDEQSEKIVDLYGKKYREIGSAYRNMKSSIDFTPTFMNSTDGQLYVNFINNFKEVQQRYIRNFDRLETINANGDSIVEQCRKSFSDIASAYKDLVSKTDFVATFSTLDGADQYEQRLSNFEVAQDCYYETIKLRQEITVNNDSIHNLKSVDKVLTSGYKNIKKNCIFTPNFTTAEQGTAFVRTLTEHIELQNKFLKAFSEHISLDSNIEAINVSAKPYKNINKAYRRLAKTLSTDNRNIISEQDLLAYIQIQRQHLKVQEKILDILRSANVLEVNQQLKHTSDVEKIKVILKIL